MHCSMTNDKLVVHFLECVLLLGTSACMDGLLLWQKIYESSHARFCIA